MAYISVADAAKKWNLSERSVRNYCAIGKIPNAVLAGKTWQIPEDAEKPKRTNAKTENALLSVLREEKKQQRKGGIYHKLAAVDLTNQPPQACDFSHELGGFFSLIYNLTYGIILVVILCDYSSIITCHMVEVMSTIFSIILCGVQSTEKRF